MHGDDQGRGGRRPRLYDPIGEKPTVMFPGTNGGSNWGGGSFDPTTGTLYVNSMDVAAFLRMVKRPTDSKIPYRSQGFGRFWDKNGYPCQAPPWGTLNGDRSEHRRFSMAITARRV